MNKRKNIIMSVLLVLVAFVYTLLVKYVDVQAIGPNGSSVGFGAINKAISGLIGVHMSLYKITEYLGYLALLIAFNYALLGILQLFKRKSLFKIDKEIIVLGVFYVVVVILYVLFEKVIINYRPVLIDGVLEASYPSSHTLLALCICGSSLIANKYLFKDRKSAKYGNIIAIVLMVSILLGRLISGVHWFSDIIGGVLISAALLKIFKTILKCLNEKA